MGLGFTIHTKIKDIEKFQQAVENQAVESGYNAEHDESSSTVSFCRLGDLWKSHATLTLLAKQDLPTFGYNMIDPLKSWCWGSILFYPFKISRFS